MERIWRYFCIAFYVVWCALAWAAGSPRSVPEALGAMAFVAVLMLFIYWFHLAAFRAMAKRLKERRKPEPPAL